ncbi:MAG TPA: acetate/propionate family kinase [Dehalococcoidia bacterium]|nr:acetate/propionate family kinase [Dehalococcoidia bacterium]
MRVLTLNCGSSSLKFDVFDVEAGAGDAVRVAQGIADRRGDEAKASLSLGSGQLVRELPKSDYAAMFEAAASLLNQAGLLTGIEAIGHRVVHGGAEFQSPVLINEAVVDAIRSVSRLAPLHNLPALAAIEAARVHFGGRLPMVATFDTAFYADLPEVASTYALPRELCEELGIRRFGFHGLAHRYMVERYRSLRPGLTTPRLITLQLGNGCSATASLGSKALDTSMGFTPLEGLIMGTRSGDIDPSLPLFLAEERNLSHAEVDELLNSRSGLLGLSGLSSDMRDLVEAAAAGHERAQLAFNAFCYRVQKYIGAYLSVLGGADALIFGGGIGENSAEVRQRVCHGLAWAGLSLDANANRNVVETDTLISTASGTMEAWVIHVYEAEVIARDVAECLASPA